ncbi:GM18966 [Drosophila sechellia]|uniref:GM18966 n=1 Tax=Drosophila sechellia TaxID=7238 RepID=B4I9G0_DROSE|nr:GM18966 [Drosophila sechellia]
MSTIVVASTPAESGTRDGHQDVDEALQSAPASTSAPLEWSRVEWSGVVWSGPTFYRSAA